MERTMSIEEKIKRAEEIYARRQEGTQRKTATVSVNNNDNKKDIKLLRKMIIQIIISLSIYLVVYAVQNNNYIFSEDFINKVNEVLSYDMNFNEIYKNIKQNIEQNLNKYNEDNKIQENNNVDGAIGGAEENIVVEDNINNENLETSQEDDKNSDNIDETTDVKSMDESISQEEQDISNIKATTTFIKPIEGTITSKFGQREPTTSTVPKNHTGIDIGANLGTKIKSSTEGEVVLVSSEGDYGKHIKIQVGEVSIIYAHCNDIYVKQGDIVTQGQEIAEVGSTGNSTGPHLHFEIRISERIIDPQKILEL